MTPVSPYLREKVANEILSSKCIPALLDLFHQADDLEDEESLGHLYQIFKGECVCVRVCLCLCVLLPLPAREARK